MVQDKFASFSDSSYPVESRNRLLAPPMTADELSLEKSDLFLALDLKH